MKAWLRANVWWIGLFIALPGAAWAIYNWSGKILPPPPPPSGMTYIPSGEFIMGTDESEVDRVLADLGGEKLWFVDEIPQ